MLLALKPRGRTWLTHAGKAASGIAIGCAVHYGRRRCGAGAELQIMNTYDAKISSRKIKELSVLQPWRSAAAIVFDWAVIAAAIAASEFSGSWWVYLACIALIAGRMHGFGVLMHEGAHYRIFRDKRLNDWVTDIFAAWPILANVHGYRQNHLAHHQHTNTDKDPDWTAKLGDGAFAFPKKAWQAAVQLLGYLVAINSARDLVRMAPRAVSSRATRRYKLLRSGYYLAWAALFTVLGIWKGVLLYWIVPYATLLFLILHVRSVAEHFGSMDYEEELGSTRTVLPHLWERLFFAPHNVNYHLEHHLYPGVPFYNLPKLHEALMQDEEYRTKAHLTRGYSTGLLRECLSAPAAAPNSAY